MNKIALIAGLAVAATGATADVLLEIDLTVANQVTISATSGLASTSATSSNFTGYLLADFFAAAGAPGSVGNGTGNLSTVGNASDGSPALFQGSSSVGLNIWSFSLDGSVGVTGGSQAFEGSSTWSLDAAQYAAFLGAATSGDIYMGADTDDDIAAGAVNIGTYAVIPAPSALALLGMGGMVATRRRR
ncbi:MAG: PEP-CTERM sorting domain-containing protein [Phycisphaerales bacterium]